MASRSFIKAATVLVLWGMLTQGGGLLSEAGELEKDVLSGRVSVEYRLERDSDTSSSRHLVTQRADLSVTPFSGGGRFVLSGDLNEKTGNGGQSPGSFLDSYGDVHGFLYEAYADTEDRFSSLRVKAGRQYAGDALPVHLDGLTARLGFPGANQGELNVLCGYGADPFGDSAWDSAKVAGAKWSFSMFEKTGVGVEFLLTHERPEDADAESFRQTAVSFTHTTERSRLGLTCTAMDSDMETARFRSSFPEIFGTDSDVFFSYVHQFREADRMPSASSPFIAILGPVKPYNQVAATVIKGFYDLNMTVSAGADYRKLVKRTDESEFNHSYVHGFAAFDKRKMWGKELRLALQADYWRDLGEGPDSRSTLSGGGEVEYGRTGGPLYALGSFYSRYAYDYYEDSNEKTDVYTVFARFLKPWGRNFRFKGEYGIDIYDRTEHRLNFGAVMDF